MILWRRITPLLAATGVLVALEVLLRSPQYFWFASVLALLVGVFGIIALVYRKVHLKEVFFLTIVSVGLVICTIALLLFVHEALIAQTVSFACAFLSYWYLENIFHYFYQPQAYQPYALENITTYCNILIAWFSFSVLYATRVFVSASIFLLIPATAVLIILLLLHIAWSAKIPFRENLPILLTETTVMTELATVVLLLPTSFYAAGLLLVIPYFLMVNLTRHHVRGTLLRPVIMRYAIIGVLTLAVTFTTAPWT